MLKCTPRVLSGWAATIFALALASGAQAELPGEEAGWSLAKEVDNIRVYTTTLEDSDFRAFRAEALLDAPVNNVMAVMTNPKSCMEWVHGCIEAQSFGGGDFHDRYAYSINNMPWPVSDRDYVLRIRTHGDQASGEVTMDLNAVPAMRDEEPGNIRVDRSDTLYRFIPEDGKTRMIWVQHTNPNGALPGWLVNSLLVDIPIKSLQALEKTAQKPRYQNYRLIYDNNGNLTAVAPPAGPDTNEE